MKNVKAKIVEVLEASPEKRQREVLEYVESLRSRDEARTKAEERDPEDNPLLDVIGGVDGDLGADRIDEQLYGEGPA